MMVDNFPIRLCAAKHAGSWCLALDFIRWHLFCPSVHSVPESDRELALL